MFIFTPLLPYHLQLNTWQFLRISNNKKPRNNSFPIIVRFFIYVPVIGCYSLIISDICRKNINFISSVSSTEAT